jgi:plastocyanin
MNCYITSKRYSSFLLLLTISLLALLFLSWPIYFMPGSERSSQSGSQEPVENKPSQPVPLSGQIQGAVRIESPIKSKSLAVSIYSRRSDSAAGGSPAAVANEVENVIVYLEGDFLGGGSSKQSFSTHSGVVVPDKNAESNRRIPSIQQIDETFVPHVLPIMTGTSVDFPNGDPFFHNVFSLSGAKSFDLGRYPQGKKRTVRFDKPGIVMVFCHIHSHMSAVIRVFDHPFFTVPDSQGQFILSDIPPGTYTLVGWHERLKAVKRLVTVKAGETLTLDVVL